MVLYIQKLGYLDFSKAQLMSIRCILYTGMGIKIPLGGLFKIFSIVMA